MSLTDWMLKHLARLRPQRPPAEQPVRLQLFFALRKLRPQDYQLYRASVGQSIMLETLYPTLDRYVQALADACRVVRDDRIIDSATIPRELFRVSLDRFLISSTGFYLNPQEAVESFKTMATQLCEAMEASDEAEYGPAEHNGRMLHSLLANALDLTRKLIEASAMS